MRVQVVAGATCPLDSRDCGTKADDSGKVGITRCWLQLCLQDAQPLFTDIDPCVGLQRNACYVDLCGGSRYD